MTVVHVRTSTKQDAEIALASLWFQVEFNKLATPDLRIQFQKPDRVRLVVSTNGSKLADRVLRQWATGCDVSPYLVVEATVPARRWVRSQQHHSLPTTSKIRQTESSGRNIRLRKRSR